MNEDGMPVRILMASRACMQPITPVTENERGVLVLSVFGFVEKKALTRTENATVTAIHHGLWRRRRRKDTTVTRACASLVHRKLAVESKRTARDQGLVEEDTGVV